MAGFKFSAFSGIRPKVSAQLLASNEAQTADNAKLFSGELRAWRRPSVVATPSKAVLGTVLSIFRLNYLGVDYWLNWLKDVDCHRGPIAGDVLQRIYFTGDGEPRMSYGSLATQAGADYPVAMMVLGVFPPQSAPALVVTGGAGSNVTRSYVYTFVTPLGEESQPSPPITITGKVDGSWDLSALETFPANTFTVTGASWAAGVATVNAASTRGLRVGEEVSVSAVLPAGYNASKVVLTEVNSGNVKYALAANPGAYSSGGLITRVASHNITGMKRRIYRVLTGTAGAEFQFVTETTGTTYSDTIADTALGEILESDDWEMPPTDMKGLAISEKNGIAIAFAKNELCLSEPFRPHAWPSKYRVAFTRDVVSVGLFSGGIVVTTKGKPAQVTGSTPGNMSPEDVEVPEPCVSKRGTISLGFGVIYPSPNGWVISGIMGTSLASEDLLGKDEFKDYFPATMVAAAHREKYFAWFTDASGNVRGVVLDKSGQGASLTTLQQAADAAWSDPETSELYIVHEGKIKLWDGDELNKLPFDWTSKLVVTPDAINPSMARVRAKYGDLGGAAGEEAAQDAVDAAYNAAILALPEVWPGQSKTHGDYDGNMLDEFMLDGSLLRDSNFSLYDSRFLQLLFYARDDAGGDMELKHTETLTSDDVFRLPDGYLANEFEVRMLGNLDVRSVDVGESMRDLKAL